MIGRDQPRFHVRNREKHGAEGMGLNDLCNRSLQTRTLRIGQPLPLRTISSPLADLNHIRRKDKLAVEHWNTDLESQNPVRFSNLATTIEFRRIQ